MDGCSSRMLHAHVSPDWRIELAAVSTPESLQLNLALMVASLQTLSGCPVPEVVPGAPEPEPEPEPGIHQIRPSRLLGIGPNSGNTNNHNDQTSNASNVLALRAETGLGCSHVLQDACSMQGFLMHKASAFQPN